MAVKVGEINGFEFFLPTSGGKAGKGFNKTSTIQVRKGGSVVKQFRFDTASIESRKVAAGRARAFALNGGVA